MEVLWQEEWLVVEAFGCKKQIRESKRYAEGTTILFSVKSENDAEQAMELIEYKLG